MFITRNFKETVQVRALRDPEFREGIFNEGMECMLSGDTGTGKAILCDYIDTIYLLLDKWSKR